MGGAGHLPYSGGSIEQPAALMRCLEAMNGAEGALDRFKRGRPKT